MRSLRLGVGAVGLAAAASCLSHPAAATRVSAIPVTAPILQQRRTFDSQGKMSDEYGFANKMRDISVITGTPKPTGKEGEWVCRFKGSDQLEGVLRKLLAERQWADVEIERELGEVFAHRRLGKNAANYANWTTVEEFQRTPWFRRFRPNDTAATHFASIEVFKIMEDELIPPSQRGDPYAHLRRRHYEDSFFNERFSEDAGRHLTREELARHTKGMPQYEAKGPTTRSAFLAFEKEYKEARPYKYTTQNEVYTAWTLHRAKEQAASMPPSPPPE